MANESRAGGSAAEFVLLLGILVPNFVGAFAAWETWSAWSGHFFLIRIILGGVAWGLAHWATTQALTLGIGLVAAVLDSPPDANTPIGRGYLATGLAITAFIAASLLSVAVIALVIFGRWRLGRGVVAILEMESFGAAAALVITLFSPAVVGESRQTRKLIATILGIVSCIFGALSGIARPDGGGITWAICSSILGHVLLLLCPALLGSFWYARAHRRRAGGVIQRI